MGWWNKSKGVSFMSDLLELIKETPPKDLQEVAIILASYLPKTEVKPQPDRLLNLKEFQQKLPIKEAIGLVTQ